MEANHFSNIISNERFELSGAFRRISDQIDYENRPKTIPELINLLVSRLEINELCGKWLKVFDLSADYINGIVDFGGAQFMVHICEALKEAAISSIAEEIALRPSRRVVLIAGPSSSGKTTFCKKLSYALQQQGLRPHGISIDDYYNDSIYAPLGPDGKPDWESIHALNLPLLQSHIAQLTAGRAVRLPRYDFTTGKSRQSDNVIQMQPGDTLLLEGIHALNPMLLEGAQVSPDSFYRIYISALTVRLAADGSLRPTTDNRLLRRMARDSQFRNTPARQTLERWTSVRRGEEKWIVPFQSLADVNFNSAYQYEYGLLRENCLPLLDEVLPDTPEYPEAQRLMAMLRLFHKVPVRHLPPYSLLREFLGGSAYEY